MRNAYGIVGLGLAVAFSASALGAQADEELWWDDDGVSYFNTAVNDYYDVPLNAPPPPSYLHPDELPVVYLLAREARVSPEVVMALREQGWTWLEITQHLGVDPYVYVHRLPRRSGYWGWYGARDYRYLTDRHIIDYVNLVFWADYYRRPVTQVIIIRQRVPTWFYYVRYHSPPRVVYVRNPTRWAYGPGWRGDRRQTVGRAQPRGGTGVMGNQATTRQPARTSTNTPTRPNLPSTRTQDRAATQPGQPGMPAARSQQTRPSAPAARSQPGQNTRPAAQPTRPSGPATRTQPAQNTRPAAQPSRPAQNTRPAAQPSRPAQNTRPAAQPSSRSGSRDAASSRGSSSSSRGASAARGARGGG